MLLPEEWRAFIGSLNSNGVEYVVVGAVALAHHGFPRYTGDLDILIRNSPRECHAAGVGTGSVWIYGSWFESGGFRRILSRELSCQLSAVSYQLEQSARCWQRGRGVR